jgi:ribose transport system permease protein
VSTPESISAAGQIGPPAPTAPTTHRSPRRVLERVAPFGSLIVLAGLVAFFALSDPQRFWTTDNLISILNEGALLGIVACGLTIPMITLNFDLSIGAMATLSGLTVALLMQHSVSPGVAILLVLLLGLLVGLVNGFVVVRLGVSAFIGTLAVMTMLQGLGTWWAGGASVPVKDQAFTSWATAEVSGIPVPVVVAGVFFLVFWFVVERTTIGRRLYAVGANREAARLGGVRFRSLQVAAFVACALAATVAGVLLTSKLFSAYQGAGDPFLLDAYAAVFLGAVTLRLGQCHILGTLIGVLLLSVMENGLQILHQPTYVDDLAKGAILVAAVTLAGTSGTLKQMARA